MIITRTRYITLLILGLLLSLTVISPLASAQDAVPIKGPKNATEQFSGSVYGPITADDTLWRIAERYRQNPNLSIYQVMVAIYDLNPEAFEQQNLNLMIGGSTLRLPSERFIERYDPQEAKARTESDEQIWMRLTPKKNSSGKNLKPPSPPVNQDDLVSTKNALEQQLKSLDETQTQQFEALRSQFAESISSVESLLEDNKQLYERIDKVNNDLDALRGQVEGDVKNTMDAQSQSIDEMLRLLKDEQALRQQQASSSVLDILKNPTVLFIVTPILSLLLIGGLGVWLLKKKRAPEPVEAKVTQPTQVVADAASISTTDSSPADEEEIADLTDDELFNDDDLLDDVLSSELEDSLDDELENFSDLSDEMLVPDTNNDKPEDDEVDELFEQGDSQLDQDELDSLFADEDDNGSAEGFDISGDLDQDDEQDTLDPDDIFEQAQRDESEATAATTQEVDDALADEEDDAQSDVAEPSISPVEADEESEISIDDLLEENAPEPNIAEKLGVENDHLDEEMLGKIDDEIQQQNQEIDAVTDNLLNEIEQLEMMGDMLDELDDADEDEIQVPEANADGIQNIDAIVDDVEEIEIHDMENADEFTDAVPDDLIEELQQSDADLLADELLDELSSQEQEIEAQSDALTDELLAELGEELGEDVDAEESLDPIDEMGDDPLTDELLAELSESAEQTEQSADADSQDSVEENDNDPLDGEDLLNELDELDDFQPPVEDVETVGDSSDDVQEIASEEPEELADVPGLDEWLNEDAESTDTSILDELENTDFDDLLNAIDEDSDSEVPDSSENTEAKLDNPDLDLDALFSEELETSTEKESADLISVDDLLEEADVAEPPKSEEAFDLDVSLADFTGEVDDDDLIDVDADSAQAANLDLARAYIDMDDTAAAKELLIEVLANGNDEQKTEAQSLLDELNDA